MCCHSVGAFTWQLSAIGVLFYFIALSLTEIYNTRVYICISARGVIIKPIQTFVSTEYEGDMRILFKRNADEETNKQEHQPPEYQW